MISTNTLLSYNFSAVIAADIYVTWPSLSCYFTAVSELTQGGKLVTQYQNPNNQPAKIYGWAVGLQSCRTPGWKIKISSKILQIC